MSKFRGGIRSQPFEEIGSVPTPTFVNAEPWVNPNPNPNPNPGIMAEEEFESATEVPSPAPEEEPTSGDAFAEIPASPAEVASVHVCSFMFSTWIRR